MLTIVLILLGAAALFVAIVIVGFVSWVFGQAKSAETPEDLEYVTRDGRLREEAFPSPEH